jgi:hypothetical protein
VNPAVLHIIFSGDQAFLAESHPIPISRLGLPKHIHSFPEPAWWKIRVIDHFRDEQRLFAEVLSYHRGEGSFTPEQLEQQTLLEEVQIISFRKLSTQGLMSTLAGNRQPIPIPVHSQDVLYIPDDDEESLFKEEDEQNLTFPAVDEQPTATATPAVTTPNPTFTYQIRSHFSVPMKEVRFKHGGVAFSRFFKELYRTVDLEIVNYELREEFDAVKNYFSNVLKAKKIQVSARLVITDGEIVTKEAHSGDIDRINKDLIDHVKFEFVKDTIRKKMSMEEQRSLFTMDELFESMTEGRVRAGAFYQSERELIEDLLQITGTKHYRHLRYLSSIHAHHIMKLRFVHKPLSFIFLLEGNKQYHIVWETLDTQEATYIWHSDKDLKLLKFTLSRIEDILNTIKVQGKIAYLNTREEPFRRICHDYSEQIDGFAKWKLEMDSVIF